MVCNPMRVPGMIYPLYEEVLCAKTPFTRINDCWPRFWFRVLRSEQAPHLVFGAARPAAVWPESVRAYCLRTRSTGEVFPMSRALVL